MLPEHLVSWIEPIYSSPGTSQTQKLWKQWDKKEFFVHCSIKQLFQATISVMLMAATQSLGSSEGTFEICGWPLGTILELYPTEFFFTGFTVSGEISQIFLWLVFWSPWSRTMHNMMTVRFAVGKLGFSFNRVSGGEGRENCWCSWIAWAKKLLKKPLQYDRIKI